MMLCSALIWFCRTTALRRSVEAKAYWPRAFRAATGSECRMVLVMSDAT